MQIVHLNLDGRRSKKLRMCILASVFVNSLSACFYATGFGTEYWFASDSVNFVNNDTEIIVGNGDVNVGLFSGYANFTNTISGFTEDLHLVCLDGQCMYSQLTSEQDRKDYLEELLASEEVPELMSEGLWVVTIIGLAGGLIFAVVGAIFAIINTVTTPIEVITGIPGLFLWNLIAAGFSFIAIVCWAVQYNDHMLDNVLIEDVEDGWTTEGLEHLAYSYWLILVAMFLHLFNCGLIYFGTLEKKVKTQFEAPASNSDNMIY